MARVLQLIGSPTNMFWADLSLLYARGALAALGTEHDFLNLVAMPDQSWRFVDGLDAATLPDGLVVSVGEAIDRALAFAPDAVVPQMFCPAGMVDCRAMFEGAGLPLLGNRAEVMAIAADKVWTRALVEAAGIAVPRGQVLRRGGRPTLAPSYIVKPAIADNSQGVSLVADPKDARAALNEAFAVCERVLVEDFIAPGREVRAGVVEIDGRAVPLPLEEYPVDMDDRPIRRARDKIAPSAKGDLSLMAKSSDQAWIVPEDDPMVPRVQKLALECHRALRCRDYSLFDFRIDTDGKPWFLEAGPYCSFAPDSVLVTMMEAAGTPLSYFFARAVEQARTRHLEG